MVSYLIILVWKWSKIAVQKKLCGDFRPLLNKNVQILDHLLFSKDSQSLKILYIWLWEVGAKRPLNGTSKSEQTDKYTDKHMVRGPRGPMLWKGIRISGCDPYGAVLLSFNIFNESTHTPKSSVSCDVRLTPCGCENVSVKIVKQICFLSGPFWVLALNKCGKNSTLTL